MVLSKETAKKTAEFLLQIKAIKLQPQAPFTWASGWNSPIYCDNRLSLSHPAIRTYIREELVKAIRTQYGTPNVIAGVATGAIAMGVLVAEQMGLPFVYIRPEAKKHGRQNKIEGQLNPAQSVVVVEDLISTGKSSLLAVEALREVKANVMGMAGIFTYDFQAAADNFKEAHCDLVTLSDYNYLIEEAVSKGYVNDSELDTLKEWRMNPDKWGK